MPTSSAAAWRRVYEEGIEVTFPSGNVGRIRPLELDFFVKRGKFPEVLTNAVYEMMNDRKSSERLPVEKMEDLKEFITFLDDLACYAFIAPIVKAAGSAIGDDEISVDDVEFFDKRFLWRFFTLSSNRLLNFRPEQSPPVADLATATSNGSSGKPPTQSQFMDQRRPVT